MGNRSAKHTSETIVPDQDPLLKTSFPLTRRIVHADITRDFDIKTQVLGTGYSGAVRLAEHKITKQPVAVKQFSKTGLKAHRLKLLKSEVEVYLRLDHPNICRLLYAYESSRDVWLVMELCSCELYSRLCKSKVGCILFFPTAVLVIVVPFCLRSSFAATALVIAVVARILVACVSMTNSAICSGLCCWNCLILSWFPVVDSIMGQLKISIAMNFFVLRHIQKFLAANPAQTQQVYCEETAQDVMRQMLQAINYLHSHNIVHRRQGCFFEIVVFLHVFVQKITDFLLSHPEYCYVSTKNSRIFRRLAGF